MTWRFALLCLLSCSRPPPDEAPRAQGMQLHGVKVTTWRGSELTAAGTASLIEVRGTTFVAHDADVKTGDGSTMRSAHVEGALDLSTMSAPPGVQVITRDGCEGRTRAPVDYANGVAVASGAVDAKGCGFTLAATGMSYVVAERRALLNGPVATRIEAAP